MIKYCKGIRVWKHNHPHSQVGTLLTSSQRNHGLQFADNTTFSACARCAIEMFGSGPPGGPIELRGTPPAIETSAPFARGPSGRGQGTKKLKKIDKFNLL